MQPSAERFAAAEIPAAASDSRPSALGRDVEHQIAVLEAARRPHQQQAFTQRIAVLRPVQYRRVQQGRAPKPEGEKPQIFDPLVHVPFEGDDSPLKQRPLDRRWLVCHRPAVLSGGELTLEMLELRYDQSTGFYQAPPHMKANNGIYIVDDLGRQQVGVTELLNRWIVPLDRRVDMFSLRNGVRFSVPFDVWPVFSTNLEPSDLGDDAFLRRQIGRAHV